MPGSIMNDAEAVELLKAHGDKYVTLRSLMGIMDSIAASIKSYNDKAAAPLLKRLDALERENAELKAVGAKTLADFYKGTWQPSAFDPYERGAAVTFDGSLWLARTTTRTKPGASEDWQMIVKRGRDGKDAT